ncbi:PREDICTED: basic 7S globulin-like [Tarenaya hassleriana]|uniref:basic 7S globulin-like n=1 Tax=Tarenaya hassleriana TaxID=28532 RepID=UPI00053C5CD4|nr:PREDICTED: basic 7S globulin-like [Tarenaya hassleriana]
MATLKLLILLLFPAAVTASLSGHSSAAEDTAKNPHAFIVQVAKETMPFHNVLYSAAIGLGTDPTASIDFVIDLGGGFPWFVCSTARYNSSSYREIGYSSPKCRLVKNPSMTSSCYPIGTCPDPSCGVDVNNPYSNRNYHGSVLSQDVMSFVSTPDGRTLGPRLESPQLVFACADDEVFEYPFPASSLGMIGLSKNGLSLPNQLTSAFRLPRKFALCLPSKPKASARGDLFIGGGPYFYPPYQGDASRLFVAAPLFGNPYYSTLPLINAAPSNDYYIGVKSIAIDGKTIPFEKSLLSIGKDGNGGTQLSSIAPCTSMHPAIFKPFFKAFMAKATGKNMVPAPSDGMYPPMACFDRRSVRRGITGPDVPVIDLLVQGGGIWRIYGSNSMVDYDENRTCLAFVDAGKEARAGIVIGSLALEDTLVEFDLDSSKFSVTSSLLMHNTSCSRFRTA